LAEAALIGCLGMEAEMSSLAELTMISSMAAAAMTCFKAELGSIRSLAELALIGCLGMEAEIHLTAELAMISSMAAAVMT